MTSVKTRRKFASLMPTYSHAPQSLLSDPNPASPANREAAELFADHKLEYQKRVLEVVEGSWSDADMAQAAKAKAAVATMPS